MNKHVCMYIYIYMNIHTHTHVSVYSMYTVYRPANLCASTSTYIYIHTLKSVLNLPS